MVNLPKQLGYSIPWRRAMVLLLALFQVMSFGCGELEQPKAEPYYAETRPPRKQEFRWSNGKAPRSLDPAAAAAPPETDIVRAVFEGLTELDPETLEPIPAAAEKWTSSADHKTWTFEIRADARWSNGDPVVAADFVRSWKRLGELGDKSAHPDLLKNIVGFPLAQKRPEPPPVDLLQPGESTPPPIPVPALPSPVPTSNSNSARTGPAPAEIGVSATGERTLQIVLLAGDKDFPKLAAHPMFRPIHGKASDLSVGAASGVVTNGAFMISAVAPDGISLEKSQTYWNRNSVTLERIKFVSFENAEQALAAYRAGEIDAVTNASFEPLALKLLEPFEDFRRRTHAAINFYEINHEKAPFDDRRVREALAISIERERLTEGEMEGQTQPALSFLPFTKTAEGTIVQDKERARDLLEDAGFPAGANFPTVRLVINRNDTQMRVARAVARMWKQNLNIETEIVAKENPEVEVARTSGDFDLVRRNTVFPTANELMSILAILQPAKSAVAEPVPAGAVGVEANDSKVTPERPVTEPSPDEETDVATTEADAVYELWAIPLYFPTSYSLVKPYVSGFQTNALDAPLLHNVSINNDWQPK